MGAQNMATQDTEEGGKVLDFKPTEVIGLDEAFLALLKRVDPKATQETLFEVTKKLVGKLEAQEVQLGQNKKQLDYLEGVVGQLRNALKSLAVLI